MEGSKELTEHGAEFARRIERVSENVVVAVGYALANSIMIEGDDGVIIVDTTETNQLARAVKEDFLALVPGKPIKAIVLTHNHADHVYGVQEMMRGAPTPPEIIAHSSLNELVRHSLSVVSHITFTRSMRQFGALLHKDDQLNSGIGPSLEDGRHGEFGIVHPTITFDDSLNITIAGVELELFHCPGETNDQICLFIPSTRVLVAADNYYKAFPNLYAIRGTPTRDAMQWARSLDRMRRFKAAAMVPCHSAPITGAAEVETRLRNYRDAIQYVHDQTVTAGCSRSTSPPR